MATLPHSECLFQKLYAAALRRMRLYLKRSRYFAFVSLRSISWIILIWICASPDSVRCSYSRDGSDNAPARRRAFHHLSVLHQLELPTPWGTTRTSITYHPFSETHRYSSWLG